MVLLIHSKVKGEEILQFFTKIQQWEPLPLRRNVCILATTKKERMYSHKMLTHSDMHEMDPRNARTSSVWL